MKFVFRIFFIYFILFPTILVEFSAEPIRRKIENFEFYFLQNTKENQESIRILEYFSDLFLAELKKETERLGLRSPGEATVFMAADSVIFQEISKQPRYAAGFYSYESKRFFFQNPNLLSERGILNSVIKHEICHFLSPENKRKDSIWLEEAYCESLYPSDKIPNLKKLGFPKDWKTLNREWNKTYSSPNKSERTNTYRKMYVFGSWLLDQKGEEWVRNLLELQNPEIVELYSKFLNDSKTK